MSSIKSLLSTVIESICSAIVGLVKSGKIIGNATEWAIRQSERWNSDEVKAREQIIHEAAIWNDIRKQVAAYTGVDVDDVTIESVKCVANELKEFMKSI